MKRKEQKGFTIVELVIVIAVIGILASALIPTFQGIVERAKQSSALTAAKNQFTQDNATYMLQGHGEGLPDNCLYEAEGYYFKSKNGELVMIDKEEYDLLSAAQEQNIQVKNIIFLIPDGAGFGTYDIANAYKKAYSSSAVNGIVDGIADTTSHRQLTQITTNRIAGETHLGLYLDDYMIASADTSMKDSAGHSATDSAAAGTALLCGQKTDYVMCGITPDFKPVANILEAARYDGKSTGFVTTKCLVDATPTDGTAHVLRRPDQNSCAYQQDASSQIINSGIDCQIMYGSDGGYIKYAKTYSEDLICNTDKARNHGYSIVSDLSSLQSVINGGATKVFSDIHINYSQKKANTSVYDITDKNYYTSNAVWNTDYQAHHLLYDVDAREGDLTLMDISKGALKVLNENINDPDGFCLVIEGGAIDNAAEGRNVKEAVSEYLAFDEVFGYCVNFAKQRKDTIVVACPDHDSGGFYNPANQGAAPIKVSSSITSINQLVEGLHNGTIADNTTLSGAASGHSSQNVPVWLYAPNSVRSQILTNLGLPSDTSASKVRSGLFYDGTIFDSNYSILNSDIVHAVTKAAKMTSMQKVTEDLFVPVYDGNDLSKYNYGTYDDASGVFTFTSGAKITKNSRQYIDKEGNTKNISVGLPIYLTNPVTYSYEDGRGGSALPNKATAVFYMPKSVYTDCL